MARNILRGMETNSIKKFRVKQISRLSGIIHEHIVTVDVEDASLLRSYYWTVVRSSTLVDGVTKENVYISRRTPNGDEFLHCLIAQAKPGERVMHINGDSLDNRKANLLKQSDRVEEIE